MKQVAIFGSTGSIGKSTLDVLRLHLDKFKVFALTGHSNHKLLFEQCREFKPAHVYISNPSLACELAAWLRDAQLATEVLSSTNDLASIASHPAVDIIMSAIVGSAGLIPTYQAAKHGKRILLANKESLVAGGSIINQAVKENHAQLIPVDSEHSAIYQALPFGYSSLDDIGVEKIILTASGGPFLNTPYDKLQHVTAGEAVKHPNWSMGQKISVDSSTLMNKGLEVIEAYWLFNARIEQIEVVVHPQSIIHSMVQYQDSSIIAQLGSPDMKTPIAYALSAPQRIESGSSRLDFTKLSSLTFTTPDTKRFPCLALAWEGLRRGGGSCAVLNAANEIAVAKFLAGKHGFYDIPQMIESAMNQFASSSPHTIEEILELDYEVRDYCQA
ncbi:MAG: 1-deoxy-D-xylulose-5-phosphate reductoisomerase [Proteobacteria bacterium]|nr:MAG: 1-deoxy-D-xylulose-5-phosphate reductoisomerase [Pseudomonadota bacterium]